MNKVKSLKIVEIKQAVADYMDTEGCSCCQDIEGHGRAKEKLAKLLNVPLFSDGSGYDFGKFKSKQLPMTNHYQQGLRKGEGIWGR